MTIAQIVDRRAREKRQVSGSVTPFAALAAACTLSPVNQTLISRVSSGCSCLRIQPGTQDVFATITSVSWPFELKTIADPFCIRPEHFPESTSSKQRNKLQSQPTGLGRSLSPFQDLPYPVTQEPTGTPIRPLRLSQATALVTRHILLDQAPEVAYQAPGPAF